MRNEIRLQLLAAAALLPSLLLALYLCWTVSAWSWHGRVFASAVVLAAVAAGLWQIPLRLRQQWHTLGSVIEAIKLGDFSLRSPGGRDSGAYGELVRELNALAGALRQQRLHTVEKQHLIERIIRDIEVAIFAFDSHDRLSLANPAALHLLLASWPAVARQDAGTLGLRALLAQTGGRVLEHEFPAHRGLWGVHVEHCLEQGLPLRLLFVTDLQQLVRAEERKAWSRLIRVLSHEVNNSLSPIASVSDSLRCALAPAVLDPELRADLDQGLQLIEGRARGLTGFIRRYADLARLPPPQRQPLDLREPLRLLSALPGDGPLALALPDAVLPIYADPVQLQQLLINLLKNAREAMVGGEGRITVAAGGDAATAFVRIVDEGPGLRNPGNVFVPFYSTKPGGSGIGLLLCRQIAEAHGGSLSLRNRADRPGCIAELRLPLGIG